LFQILKTEFRNTRHRFANFDALLSINNPIRRPVPQIYTKNCISSLRSVLRLSNSSMNYTGNPRHLRTHPRRRSSQKEYFYRRQQFNTSSALAGRPQLDICQNFQEQWAPTTAASAAAILLGSQAKKTPSVSPDDTESLQVKRRRLLQQKDWLGLEISAPIKVLLLCSAIKIET
jgi:hypothetical protein